MKKIITALALATLSLPTIANTDFYVEFLMGTAHQKADAGAGSSVSGRGTSWGVRGGYQLADYIAVELAFQDYGEAKESSDYDFEGTALDGVWSETLETTAFNLGFKAVIPFSTGFSLNARMGLSVWEVEYNLSRESSDSLAGLSIVLDDNGNNMYWGIGAQYDFSNDILIGFEYRKLEANLNTSLPGLRSVDHTIENMSLSIARKF